MTPPLGGEALLSGLLWFAATEGLLALGACALERRHERRRIGATLASAGTRPRRRRALATAQIVALPLPFALPVALRAPAALLLLAAASIALLAPWPGERRLGERGIASEGRARRYEDVDEWRLGGGHLRARFGGEWVAAPVASSQDREALRARLLEIAPERESTYRA